MKVWMPTKLGKAVTGAEDWRIELNEPLLTVTVRATRLEANISAADAFSMSRGIVWAAIQVRFTGVKPLWLDGISNRDARDFMNSLNAARGRLAAKLELIERIRRFGMELAAVMKWATAVTAAFARFDESRWWVPRHIVLELLAAKPTGEFAALLEDETLTEHLDRLQAGELAAIAVWESDLEADIAALNERHVQREMIECSDFLSRVERTPLTPEQCRAVITFDDRVQAVAAAGSGKTSTMVAKAGYAMHRKMFPAERILLLAFNADAAAELRERVRARLGPLGFAADLVVAKTFHAFGLEAIGHATGKRPSLAPWLEAGGDMRKVGEIVDALKDESPAFRGRWDLFRIVFGRDLPPFGKDGEHAEDWDAAKKASGFMTAQGEVVKSRGEKILADWLYYNGVEYVYEGAYEVETADATHRQYRPDFYLPAADAYLEHWAVDANGNAPPHFTGYAEGMKWKRDLHRSQGTRLLETTMAGVWSGEAFEYLTKALEELRVTLDPNPDRPTHERAPIESEELVRSFRTFLVHVKTNLLTMRDLTERLAASSAHSFRFRYQMFLGLFEEIWTRWEKDLKRAKAIDFEDMLNAAVGHLERGDWKSPYELVMVDEFQDASGVRARMSKALVDGRGRYLFAVGDDWQSINRFAGADMTVMTRFDEWFGVGQTLRLERTFRCPQSLCAISSEFVQQNPNQLRKNVVSSSPELAAPLEIISVQDDESIASSIRTWLRNLHEELVQGRVPGGREERLSVFVLGRYRRDTRFMPLLAGLEDRLAVKFMTIHASKGLEADYVVVPRMAGGGYGFPSSIADDPVLQLAMPPGDSFPLAEERRLMYVAMTRARRSVLLVTLRHRESSFVLELARRHGIDMQGVDGQSIPATELCPGCGQGALVPRNGRYGPFVACNRFPKCTYKKSDRKGKAYGPTIH